jgi:hypothetical protein
MNPETFDHRPFTRKALEASGFEGFVTFDALRRGEIKIVPRTGGVYVVLREGDHQPVFLRKSVGGHFKGQDPTVELSALEANWIEVAETIYIGKGDDLRRRLREYMNFGAGRPVGHRGGRYIWQLSGSGRLLVAWRATRGVPREVEIGLMREFRLTHGGRLPFANLAG